MENGYLIKENGFSIESQIARNEIACIRVSKVSDYILGSDFLLDFDNKKPLVSELDYKSFETQLQKEHYFENLPRWVKEIVIKAEKKKHFDKMFEKYLNDREISRKEYKTKTNKVKEDLFYDWLFINKLDISILN